MPARLSCENVQINLICIARSSRHKDIHVCVFGRSLTTTVRAALLCDVSNNNIHMVYIWFAVWSHFAPLDREDHKDQLELPRRLVCVSQGVLTYPPVGCPLNPVVTRLYFPPRTSDCRLAAYRFNGRCCYSDRAAAGNYKCYSLSNKLCYVKHIYILELTVPYYVINTILIDFN